MPAPDISLGRGGNPSGPSADLFPITPNDGADLAYFTTGIYIGGAGDVAVLDRTGSAPVIFRAVPAGTVLPIRVMRILATGTTATGIVGLA